MAVLAKRQKVAPVMLTTPTSDKVVDLHPPDARPLGIPADGTGSEEGGKLLEQKFVRFSEFAHAPSDLPSEAGVYG